MALANPQLYITGNLIFFVVGLALAVAVSILAGRHAWLVAYGPEQGRLRLWIAVCLVILALVCTGAIAFNLLFS